MNAKQDQPKDLAVVSQWRSILIFALVIAVAVCVHAIGSVSQVEFVYGGL